MKKAITELIDELIIVYLKLYHVIGKKHEAAATDNMEECGQQGIIENTFLRAWK